MIRYTYWLKGGFANALLIFVKKKKRNIVPQCLKLSASVSFIESHKTTAVILLTPQLITSGQLAELRAGSAFR